MVAQKIKDKKWWKILAIGLKVLVFVLLFWSIYKELSQRSELSQIWEEFQKNLNGNPFFWLLALVLMPLNWGLESRKWQLLIQKIEKLSFVQSIRAVCCGITLSMFTPNRTGDFGGRVLLLKNAKRLEGIAITLVGSLSQLIAAVFIGLVSTLLFVNCFADSWLKSEVVFPLIAFLFVFMILGLLLFYNLKWVKKIPFLKKWHPYINPAVKYSIKELNQALIFSALRQFVFAFQFFILLRLMGVTVGFFDGMIMVFTIFFIQTFTPSIALIELGVRGKIALAITKVITANEIAVLSASFLLWGINLLIPALIGAYIIGRTRLFE